MKRRAYASGDGRATHDFTRVAKAIDPLEFARSHASALATLDTHARLLHHYTSPPAPSAASTASSHKRPRTAPISLAAASLAASLPSSLSHALPGRFTPLPPLPPHPTRRMRSHSRRVRIPLRCRPCVTPSVAISLPNAVKRLLPRAARRSPTALRATWRQRAGAYSEGVLSGLESTDGLRMASHGWHVKRFAMRVQGGVHVPAHSAHHSSRSRATCRVWRSGYIESRLQGGCVVHDASYHVAIHVCGPVVHLVQALNRVTDPNLSATAVWIQVDGRYAPPDEEGGDDGDAVMQEEEEVAVAPAFKSAAARARARRARARQAFKSKPVHVQVESDVRPVEAEAVSTAVEDAAVSMAGMSKKERKAARAKMLAEASSRSSAREHVQRVMAAHEQVRSRGAGRGGREDGAAAAGPARAGSKRARVDDVSAAAPVESSAAAIPRSLREVTFLQPRVNTHGAVSVSDVFMRDGDRPLQGGEDAATSPAHNPFHPHTLTGAFECAVDIHAPDAFPASFIAPVRLQWQPAACTRHSPGDEEAPVLRGQLCIWVHPTAAARVVAALRTSAGVHISIDTHVARVELRGRSTGAVLAAALPHLRGNTYGATGEASSIPASSQVVHACARTRNPLHVIAAQRLKYMQDATRAMTRRNRGQSAPARASAAPHVRARVDAWLWGASSTHTHTVAAARTVTPEATDDVSTADDFISLGSSSNARGAAPPRKKKVPAASLPRSYTRVHACIIPQYSSHRPARSLPAGAAAGVYTSPRVCDHMCAATVLLPREHVVSFLRQMHAHHGTCIVGVDEWAGLHTIAGIDVDHAAAPGADTCSLLWQHDTSEDTKHQGCELLQVRTRAYVSAFTTPHDHLMEALSLPVCDHSHTDAHKHMTVHAAASIWSRGRMSEGDELVVCDPSHYMAWTAQIQRHEEMDDYPLQAVGTPAVRVGIVTSAAYAHSKGRGVGVVTLRADAIARMLTVTTHTQLCDAIAHAHSTDWPAVRSFAPATWNEVVRAGRGVLLAAWTRPRDTTDISVRLRRVLLLVLH